MVGFGASIWYRKPCSASGFQSVWMRDRVGADRPSGSPAAPEPPPVSPVEAAVVVSARPRRWSPAPTCRCCSCRASLPHAASSSRPAIGKAAAADLGSDRCICAPSWVFTLSVWGLGGSRSARQPLRVVSCQRPTTRLLSHAEEDEDGDAEHRGEDQAAVRLGVDVARAVLLHQDADALARRARRTARRRPRRSPTGRRRCGSR